MRLEPIFVNHALDRAVATAANELLPCNGAVNSDIANRLTDQLERLANLAAGAQPNYNDRITAVLYGTWFQLGHVNLAIGVARLMIQRWKGQTDAGDYLRVLDIGSGTLALPIAFDVLRSIGELDINVRIFAIEQSREMEYFGRRVRHLLGNMLPWIRGNHEVSVVYGILAKGSSASPHYFSMMHTMYPGSKGTVHPKYYIATLT